MVGRWDTTLSGKSLGSLHSSRRTSSGPQGLRPKTISNGMNPEAL